MAPSPRGDAAIVSVYVAVAPAVAFEVFTRELNGWWRQGPAYRGYVAGELILEPRLGGRLFESSASEPNAPALERGRVLVWEPPTRLALSWRGGNFAPHESTRIEVLFEPQGAGTCVTLHHSGWAALRADHPARHGSIGVATTHMIGRWWGELLSGLREHLDQLR
jgi:uncharacterized protein YndB with AHSA1/START domain